MSKRLSNDYYLRYRSTNAVGVKEYDVLTVDSAIVTENMRVAKALVNEANQSVVIKDAIKLKPVNSD